MTPDQDLSARLAEFAKSDCRDNEFAKWCQTAWQAYSTGQLITLADHERAVQAAVAEAVEACEDEIYGLIDDRFSGALALRDAARKDRDTAGAAIHNEAVQTLADLRAAIRSRGVAG